MTESTIVYDIGFDTILEAFEDCCKNKRNSPDCIAFMRSDYESKLYALWHQISTGTYAPDVSTCFIVTVPVYREVFAAAFIDRIVHHWIALRLMPILEARFVEQGNVSKNCRKGEGPLSAVRRMQQMMRNVQAKSCTGGWVYQADLKGFFMSIRKDLLWELISEFVVNNYTAPDRNCLLYLLRITIFHRPQDKCVRRSAPSMWNNLPPGKSLFDIDDNCGVAIGNLPSQLLANFIGSVFDDFALYGLGIGDYERFVDDFASTHVSLDVLLAARPKMKEFLESIHLTLHPKKQYIQRIEHGIKFVGAVVYPDRTYIANRTLGHFYSKLHKFNQIPQEQKLQHLEQFVAMANSYLGMMKQHRSYNIRRKVCLEMILPNWSPYVYFKNGLWKVCVKNRYKKLYQMRKQVRERKLADILTPEIA